MDKTILTSALEGFIARLEKTEKFVIDQAPEICRQMIKEKQIQAIPQLVAGVFCLLFALVLIPVSIHNGLVIYTCQHNDGSMGCSEPTIFFGLLILAVVSLIAGVIHTWLGAYMLMYLRSCPKLFLLREFRRLVK